MGVFGSNYYRIGALTRPCTEPLNSSKWSWEIVVVHRRGLMSQKFLLPVWGPISGLDCFDNIKLHKQPIRAQDSSNWSLWANKGLTNKKWGLGSLGGIWGHFGSKSVNFPTLVNYIPNWSSWSRDCKKLIFEVSRGHPTPNWGHLWSFGVKIENFSNLGKLYTKLKPLVPWSRKNGFQGHLTPN